MVWVAVDVAHAGGRLSILAEEAHLVAHLQQQGGQPRLVVMLVVDGVVMVGARAGGGCVRGHQQVCSKGLCSEDESGQQRS